MPKRTFNSTLRRILKIFPGAEACEDLDGQIVIYTGMRCVEGPDGGFIIPYEDEIDDALDRPTMGDGGET